MSRAAPRASARQGAPGSTVPSTTGENGVGVSAMGPQVSTNCGIFWSTVAVASVSARGEMGVSSPVVACTPSSAAIVVEIEAASRSEK
jgi:hypothetical protein